MVVNELLNVMNKSQNFKIVSHWLGCEYQIDDATIKADIKEVKVEDDTLILSIDY